MDSLIKPSFRELTTYLEDVKKDVSASGAALIIMKDNEIIHEYYSGAHHFETGARRIDAASQFNVYSVRVTYISLALAIAIDEGMIHLDDNISDHLEELDKGLWRETTIRHLVTRCTGLQKKGKQFTRFAEPGTNIEGKKPDLIATIIQKRTGKTVYELLRKRVFQPLNWTHTAWMTTGKETLVSDIYSTDSYPSIRLGSSTGEDRNLYINARELALWGNLHLNKGLVDGNQVLPRKIFDLVSRIQSPKPYPVKLPKFGFLWWIKDQKVDWKYDELGSDLPTGSYQILGASGCSCTVIPKLNTVAVRMYNSLATDKKKTYDYVKDIQQFGNLVVSSVSEYISQNS